MGNKGKRNFTRFERSTIFVMAEQDWDMISINKWLKEYQGLNGFSPRQIGQRYLENVRYANSLALRQGRMDRILEYRSGANTNCTGLINQTL